MTDTTEDIKEAKSLEGLMPESWLCVDFGVGTAPGFSSRAEVEKAFFADGKDSVNQTIGFDAEVYTVRDAVWKASGMGPYGGCLCFGCLEKRLGRALRPKDFQKGHVFNTRLPGTERLMRREKRWT